MSAVGPAAEVHSPRVVGHVSLFGLRGPFAVYELEVDNPCSSWLLVFHKHGLSQFSHTQHLQKKKKRAREYFSSSF